MEILTRLNPKTSQMDSVGHSTVQGLTSADVAAALSRSSDIGYLALKRRYLDDKAKCSGWYRIYEKVAEKAKEGAWRYRNKAIKGGELKKLLDICLDDYFEKFPCQKCGATGVTLITEIETEICNQCHGQKLRQRYDYERAQKMGISKDSFSRNWRERHKQVMDLLDRTIPNKEINSSIQFRKLMRRR